MKLEEFFTKEFCRNAIKIAAVEQSLPMWEVVMMLDKDNSKKTAIDFCRLVGCDPFAQKFIIKSKRNQLRDLLQQVPEESIIIFNKMYVGIDEIETDKIMRAIGQVERTIEKLSKD